MPLTETQPDAVAHVYARSLLELVRAEGRDVVEETLGELEELLELARENSAFGEFLASRVLSTESRAKSLGSMFDGRLRPTTLKFLQVLNAKDRLGHLPAIVAAFDGAVQEEFGRVEVDVFTAQPVGGDDLQRIKDKLSASLGKDVIVHPYTDESMIGGIRLRVGDQLIDGSVAANLRRMGEQLRRDGAARVRASSSDLLGGE
ncbi:MAG: ATP synthase F1 subunit delta [Planctomycetota bacterium]